MKNIILMIKERKIDDETLWGGIFGIVAIIAAILEAFLGNTEFGPIIGSVKDISSTITLVILLFAAIISNMPKDEKTAPFSERLEKALCKWQEENSNMIVRNPEYDVEHKGEPASCYGLGLKTNVLDFYKGITFSKNCGLFLRMPVIDESNYCNGGVRLKFYLNKGTFYEGIDIDKDTLANSLDVFAKTFAEFITGKFGKDGVCAEGNKKEIIVEFKKPIKTDEDIDLLINVINSMYLSYLVCANVNVKTLR